MTAAKPTHWFAVKAFYLLVTALLGVICAWKGERPLRWRWGGE